MPEDHITGLITAIETDNNEEAKRHVAGLAYELLNLARRAVDALEKLAE